MKKIFLLLFISGLLTINYSFRKTPVDNVTSTGSQKTSLLIKQKPTFEETITLTGLETKPFVPPKAPGSGGDNDFFSHGPAVNITVELFVKTKTLLYARVTMSAKEIGGDNSEARGSKEYFLYFAGFGNEILSIQTPTLSTLSYNDDDHGEDYVGKTGRVKASDAKAYWNESPSFASGTELVRFCVTVGDTEGSEIGNKTGVRVYFNPITLKLKNTPPGPINNFSLNVVGSPSCGESTCSASCGSGLLGYYGTTVSCETFWNREKSVGHVVNWIRDNHIANMGMPPSILRDKLKEWKPDVQLRNLTPANYMSEIRKIIKDQRRPVIALVSWGSRGIKDRYLPPDDSYGFSNAILHYVIIDGWDDGSVATTNQKCWHVIDNGVRKTWSIEYFATAFFWKPENFAVEGILYPQDVHPGNIVY